MNTPQGFYYMRETRQAAATSKAAAFLCTNSALESPSVLSCMSRMEFHNGFRTLR